MNGAVRLSSSPATAITPSSSTPEADVECEALLEVALVPVLEIRLTSLKSSTAEWEATEVVNLAKEEEALELDTALDATCEVTEPRSARVGEAEYDSWTSEIDTADVSLLPDLRSVTAIIAVVRI